MTSRRCTVLEQGACEQPGLNGYEVRIIPTGPDKLLPTAHPAARKPGERRSIRISECSTRLATMYRGEECFARVILRYRTEMARRRDLPIRYRIRFPAVHPGYRCSAILPARIQENLPTGKLPVRLLVEEAP